MSKVTTALIGCGGRGSGHGKIANNCEKLSLVAVCDIDQSQAKNLGEMLGVEYTQDYHELLSRDDLDSVIIATGTKQHGQIAIDAAKAGKHMLIEKPMVDYVSTGKELIAAAEESNIIGMVGYQQRFTPFASALKSEASKIEPLQLLMTVQRGLLRQVYFLEEHFGGIIDTATHTINLALWVMEDVPSGVYATTRRGTFTGDRTIDFANIMVNYENGERTATIITSMVSVEIPNIIQIVGRHGTLNSIGRRSLRVAKHRGFDIEKRKPINLEVETVEPESDERNPTEKMHAHFADLISGAVSSQQGATLSEGMLAVSVSQAMAESAKRDEPVLLSEILEE